MDRGDCGGRAGRNRCIHCGVLPGHAAAVCLLPLPDPQHKGDWPGLAALSGPGNAVLLAEPGGGILLSAGGGADCTSLRGRVLAVNP